MTSRILSFIAGAALVATLVYMAPAAMAQTQPGAPGTCPNSAACQQGQMMPGHMSGRQAQPMAGQRGQGMSGGLIGVAADKLGITRQDLLVELQGGKTIADIAKAKGVDVTVIVNAFVSSQSVRLDTLVQNGAITQAQADDAKESMRTHITVLVNSPLESWVRQAHEPMVDNRPANAGQGMMMPGMARGRMMGNGNATPGEHGPRGNR